MNDIINLEKSKILPKLLNQLVDALLPFHHDIAIKQCCNFLKNCPTQCSANELLADLNQLATIIKSYNHKFSNEPENIIQVIPHLIYNCIQEVEHLSTITKTKTANLLKQINKFVKLT